MELGGAGWGHGENFFTYGPLQVLLSSLGPYDDKFLARSLPPARPLLHSLRQDRGHYGAQPNSPLLLADLVVLGVSMDSVHRYTSGHRRYFRGLVSAHRPTVAKQSWEGTSSLVTLTN